MQTQLTQQHIDTPLQYCHCATSPAQTDTTHPHSNDIFFKKKFFSQKNFKFLTTMQEREKHVKTKHTHHVGVANVQLVDELGILAHNVHGHFVLIVQHGHVQCGFAHYA